MTQKQGSRIAVLLLSGLYFCFFAFLYLRMVGGFLLQRSFGVGLGLIVLWILLPLVGLFVSFWLTKKPQYPAYTAPKPLPDYTNAHTYADSTVTFYPEPQDCQEPPRTPPAPPDSKAGTASMGFLLGLLGCLTPFGGIVPGCVAICLVSPCYAAPKGATKKEWPADCRRRAVSGFVLGICACIGQVVLCSVAGNLL